MHYRKDKHGEDISILGYGCMRFTTKGGKIDIDKAEKEIMLAFENGVNYYDTAYIYPGSCAPGFLSEPARTHTGPLPRAYMQWRGVSHSSC